MYNWDENHAPRFELPPPTKWERFSLSFKKRKAKIFERLGVGLSFWLAFGVLAALLVIVMLFSVASHRRQQAERLLMNQLQDFHANYIPTRIFVGIAIIGLLLLLLGLAEIFFPKVFWSLKHFISVQDGKPTDFILAMYMIGGVVTIVIAFVIVIGVRTL